MATAGFKKLSAKERGLVKGALRRIFSRSDLRKETIKSNSIQHQDANRPRVTKWAFCSICGCIEAQYLMEVDHLQPVIGIGESLEDLTADKLIDRLWCESNNLMVVCKSCHKVKTREEARQRAVAKRMRKMQK